MLFDEDKQTFEINAGRLFILADRISSEGRDLFKAVNQSLETGFACIGIDHNAPFAVNWKAT
ncbi:MAG: hypothetical protein IJU76_14765 [Desulfovibrionaceae bacterium]|nr:hypothetical protein [Desulfovibrionaceae bacterium]